MTVPAALGATRLASVDGSLADDTITFSYDELGRELNHAVNGAADSVTYDSLGRVSSATNPLGSFTYGYVDVSGRLASVSAPNGETTAYSYYLNEGDKQLQTLQHFQPSGSNRSRFDYAYDQEHMIVEWDKQLDADESAPLYLDYDGADQLIDWTNNRDGWGATSGSMQSYVYDAAGNRQSDTYQAWPGGGASWGTSNTQSWTANVLNELTTVQGPAPTPTPRPGPIHKPGEQPPPPPPTTFSYDGNGNTIGRVYSNGSGNSFEWDAANRLTAITYSGNTNRTEFTYDGLSRRVKIVEKTDGTVTSTKQFVWNGMRIAEERDGDNNVTRRYYNQGEERIGGSDAGVYYYTRDHLGSIRELSDPAGSLRARYDYDPFGNTTKASGDLSVDFGYTGHYYHAASNLYLAPYRAYDATIGKWISRDPIAEDGGLNLYDYVMNRPIGSTDRTGLCCDGAAIEAGARILTDQVQNIRDGTEYAAKCVGSLSCQQQNIQFLYPRLGTIPKCWTCVPEHRFKDANNPLIWFGIISDDHWVVTCRARDASGAVVKELIFDLWGGVNGGPRADFLRNYPYPGR